MNNEKNGSIFVLFPPRKASAKENVLVCIERRANYFIQHSTENEKSENLVFDG